MKKVTVKVLTRLTQYEVASLAVYLLGGASRSVDTEDVAVKCHELAPRLFSWQKYRDQINLELVRVSLSDAKKLKNGGLLSGSGREGWRVSSRGLDWIRERQQTEGSAFASPADSTRPRKFGSMAAARRNRERLRIIGTDAWQQWTQTRSMDAHAAQPVFRIDEYTTASMTAVKVARLRALFDAQDELTDFLRAASEYVLRNEPR